ncbi:MAG: TonB-dependent receptor [Myxococcales bacterium]|nr:TonB-dependent receptor [Myxococcales bacterium]
MGRKAIILAVCMCVSAHAWAQGTDDPRRAAARRHYQEGTKAFDLGHYDEAIKEYEEAYRNFDDPVLLYNLAQAHRLAGHTPDALRLYKVYLNRAPKATNRVEVQTKIAALEKVVEEQRRSQNIPPDQPIRPGSGPSTSTQAEPSSAQPTTPTVTTTTAQPVVTTAQPAPVTRPDRPAVPGRGKKIGGLALAVVGLGAVGAGIAMGVLAKNAGDAVTAEAKAHEPFQPAKESAGQTNQILEGVFIGVGAAAIAGGAVLYYFGRREAARAGYHGVVVAPSISPQHVGAFMQVSF